MNKKMPITACLLAALLAGCGSDKGGGVAPSDSTIQINPSEKEYTYTGQDTGLVAETPITVTVLNRNGNPLRNTEVRMYHFGDGSLASYPDRTPQAEPYIAKTDDFGNVSLFIYTPLFNIVGSTEEDFEVFSGSAYANIPITMTCTDTNTTTADICD